MTNLIGAINSSFILNALLGRAGSIVVVALLAVSFILCIACYYIKVKKANIVVAAVIALLLIISIMISLLKKEYILGMIVFITMVTYVLSVIIGLVEKRNCNNEETIKEG